MTEDEAVMRYAFAAMLRTLKPSKKAIRRCRKRVARTLKDLRANITPLHETITDPAPARAHAWVQRGCDVCGRCKGA